MVVHNGPDRRVSERTGNRTDLGSRVLFEPEIAVGIDVSARLSVEASWVHISTRSCSSRRNPAST